MEKEKILFEISILEDIIKNLQKRIKELNKLMKEDEVKDKPQRDGIIDDLGYYNLGYYNYLKITKGLSSRSIQTYFHNLSGVKKRLAKYANYDLECEIYEIEDFNKLIEIKNILKNCQEFIKDNLSGHHAFSAAFNNYCSYVYSKYEIVPSEFVLDE